MNTSPNVKNSGAKREPGIVEVLVHSFFVIPFIISVFALLFFFMWRTLAYESESAYHYLQATNRYYWKFPQKSESFFRYISAFNRDDTDVSRNYKILIK